MGKRIFWLMMLILVLTISCGEKKESSKGAGAEKEITLRFSWWGEMHVIKLL